ncbi:MAG: KdsC family phosphatase [Thermodesulfobacteriota bacterium]
MESKDLSEKARLIRVIILDVDGVLTDGSIGYGSDKEETKFFNVKDGFGIKMLRRAGLKVGILTSRRSSANRLRAEELALDFIYEGEEDKLKTFGNLLSAQMVRPEECLYIGDDVPDIPLIQQVGIGVAVADAAPELLQAADMQTKSIGGHGAVREVAVWLLQQRGIWDDLLKQYTT